MIERLGSLTPALSQWERAQGLLIDALRLLQA